MKQKILDFICGGIASRETFGGENEDYWVGYRRAGLFSSSCCYVGKYIVHRTFDEIDKLVPELILLLKAREIDCFKYKNKESQSQQAVGYSLSLQMGTNENNHSKLRGIKPIWSNKETPIDAQFSNDLPPLFIYLTEKQRQEIEPELDKLGLEDRIWIDDNRSLMQLTYESVTERSQRHGCVK